MDLKQFLLITNFPMSTIFAKLKKQPQTTTVLKTIDQEYFEDCYFSGQTTHGIPNGHGVLWSHSSIYIGDVIGGVRTHGFYYEPGRKIIFQIEKVKHNRNVLTGRMYYRKSGRLLLGVFNNKFLLLSKQAKIQFIFDGWLYSGECLQQRDDVDMHGLGVIERKTISMKAKFHHNIPVKLEQITNKIYLFTEPESVHPRCLDIIGWGNKFYFAIGRTTGQIQIFTQKFGISGTINRGQFRIYKGLNKEKIIVRLYKDVVIHYERRDERYMSIVLYGFRFRANFTYDSTFKRSNGHIIFREGVRAGIFLNFYRTCYDGDHMLQMFTGKDDVIFSQVRQGQLQGQCWIFHPDYSMDIQFNTASLDFDMSDSDYYVEVDGQINILEEFSYDEYGDIANNYRSNDTSVDRFRAFNDELSMQSISINEEVEEEARVKITQSCALINKFDSQQLTNSQIATSASTVPPQQLFALQLSGINGLESLREVEDSNGSDGIDI